MDSVRKQSFCKQIKPSAQSSVLCNQPLDFGNKNKTDSSDVNEAFIGTIERIDVLM